MWSLYNKRIRWRYRNWTDRNEDPIYRNNVAERRKFVKVLPPFNRTCYGKRDETVLELFKCAVFNVRGREKPGKTVKTRFSLFIGPMSGRRLRSRTISATPVQMRFIPIIAYSSFPGRPTRTHDAYACPCGNGFFTTTSAHGWLRQHGRIGVGRARGRPRSEVVS